MYPVAPAASVQVTSSAAGSDATPDAVTPVTGAGSVVNVTDASSFASVQVESE